MMALMGLIVLTTGCTGNKYGDLIEVNTRFVVAMQDYIDATGKATNAAAMAEAIDDFAVQVEKLAPRMKEVRTKYPDLGSSTEVPKELKELEAKSKDLEQKIVASYMNMMQYMMDPKVQAAQQKLQQAMMKMQ